MNRGDLRRALGRPGVAVSSLREQRERDRSARGTLERARLRQAGIFVVIVLVLATLFARVAYWQIAQHATLEARADAEHLRALSVPAGRGTILDASGRVLAVSVTEDTVIADPDVIRGVDALDATVTTLSGLIGVPAAEVRRQVAVPGAYVRLDDANGHTLLLTPEQTSAVNDAIAAGHLPGIALIPQVRRIYPSGALASQVLGFVRPSDNTGQYGIEQQYQGQLGGKPGRIYTAVDAQGNPLATGPRRQEPAVPGVDLTLTLDATVQYWVEQGLAQTVAQTRADGGTVIVMDPHTGAILAMASLPAFDPNAYAQAPLSSFDNPAVSAAYDPGSVMKAMTMAMGIDAGVISPGTVFNDPGEVTVDGVHLHNWDYRAHGSITMTQVLQYSANTGAVWVARRVGRDSFNHYLTAFGFGSRTGVNLPGESGGLLPKTQSAGDAQLEMAENAFGESIGVTPLQMVAAYGALANGGVLMRPYIVTSATADDGQGATTTYGPHEVRRVVSGDTARTVTQMLTDSAYLSEAEMDQVHGYTIAAKTGTSTPDAANPQRTFASVIGYAPASNPRFVLLVKLNHPQTDIFGGSAAGPLWRTLAQQLFVYYQIPPDAPDGAR
jgi:cell division protein FtsI/penicillin-binding protein 2